MSSNPQAIPKRRHGAALEKVLLEATWEELKEVGYKQLSFDNVAKRAGTSKSVLYRRWAKRLDLVRAALRSHRPLLSGPIPDTGSLRGDVMALLEHMAQVMSEVPDIVWGMAVDAISDKQLHASFPKEIKESNVKVMKAILKQAEARGEVTTAAIPDRLITLPIDLARHEMLITGQPPTKTAITQIVDDIYTPLLELKPAKDA
jgi:AcrR family transcriptional regulator